jgi:hypothetical protein
MARCHRRLTTAAIPAVVEIEAEIRDLAVHHRKLLRRHISRRRHRLNSSNT